MILIDGVQIVQKLIQRTDGLRNTQTPLLVPQVFLPEFVQQIIKIFYFFLDRALVRLQK